MASLSVRTIQRIENGKTWSLWVAAAWGLLLRLRGVHLCVLREAVEKWKHQRLQTLLRK